MSAGIQYSDDKLLQTRLFSYPDTQRHRLGPNYLLLPVNAPKCAYHNNHHEGSMNTTFRDEEVNYFPSRWVALSIVGRPQNRGLMHVGWTVWCCRRAETTRWESQVCLVCLVW